MRRVHRLLTASLAVSLIGLAPTAGATLSAATPKVKAIYAAPGPYAAGVTTVTIGDRQAEVWYPIAKKSAHGKHKDVYEIVKWLPQGLQDLVASKGIKAPFTTNAYRDVKVSKRGPFPMVIFAHGFGSYRDQSTFLTTHLASWGFVVPSPDFLERGLGAQLGAAPAVSRTEADVIDSTIATVRAASARKHGVLSRSVAPHAEIAITGHSAGGRTAITYGAHRNVITYIPLAGAAAAFRQSPAATPPRGKSSLYIAGATDGVVATDGIKTFYRTVPAPKRLVVIDRVGHLNAMSDICEIGKGGGGVVALAQQAGLPVPETLARLGTDGCFKPAYRSTKVWPITRHFEVAQLRYAFGINKAPIGLGPSIVKAFAPVTVTYSITRATHHQKKR